MKNTIKVTIPFSYKGIEHTPSSVIDLDLFIQGDQTIDAVYHHVANDNKIDNYSYEYEVLESSTKIFSEPTGIAKQFLSDNSFDLDGFKKQLVAGDVYEKLQTIAADVLNIDNLDKKADIKEALVKAYQAGADNNKNRN